MQEAIVDLYEHRPATYSYRLQMIVAGEMMGLKDVQNSLPSLNSFQTKIFQSMSFLPYGPTW